MNSSFTKSFVLAAVLILLCLPWSLQAGEIQTPEEYFGFIPGTDRELFDYGQLIGYLQVLDQASPRVKLVEIGASPMGKTLYLALLSSAENIENIDRLKEIARRLALDPAIPDEEREELIEEGRVFVMGTLSMHSTEVAPTQASPLIAYELATTENPERLAWLDDTVYLMVPCHNPDGMDMVVNHYRKYKGTKHEGSYMPGVYHKYVGHDNNRDFVTLSQEDTRAIARVYNLEWYPQVMVEKHQMGSTGPRYFVPPPHDPIAENIDAGVWHWVGIFGSNMAKDMTEKGLAGVSQHYLFDEYWPGHTETCLWKNVIGFLTEAASVHTATPIFVEPNELKTYGKGLAEYKKGINMPLPWPGGWWRLGDIVEYEVESTTSMLKTASLHRREILQFRNDLCRREVERGRSEAPYFYILPREQHDPSSLVAVVDLLLEHGVQVHELKEEVTVDHRTYSKGDLVVSMAQPFRPFAKEVLERQRFPERHYTPGGELIRPYDVTSWSLPLHYGVEAVVVNSPAPKLTGSLSPIAGDFRLTSEIPDSFSGILLPVTRNESFALAFRAAGMGFPLERTAEALEVEGVAVPEGSFYLDVNPGSRDSALTLLEGATVDPLYLREPLAIETHPLTLPRIGLVENWLHDMDAGWTRFLFDTYGIPYRVIRPAEMEKRELKKEFDLLVFPDADKDVLLSGTWKEDDGYVISGFPPEYAKGMGDKGKEKLASFLDDGGVILSWGRSAALFTDTLKIPRGEDEFEEFHLPVKDISKGLKESGFYCPGSLLKLRLVEDHPLTRGLPGEIGIFYRGGPVFSTSIPIFDMDRRVIGRLPEQGILLSGYCKDPEKAADKSLMVWLKKGKGQVVLFGFNPQFRASTPGSYKLLFNALLLQPVE